MYFLTHILYCFPTKGASIKGLLRVTSFQEMTVIVFKGHIHFS